MSVYEKCRADYSANLSRDSWIDMAFGLCFGVLGSIIAMAVLS